MTESVPPGSADGPPRKRAPRQLPAAALSPDDLQAIFGQNLRIARLKRGLTLMEMAQAASMTNQYLSQIEQGKKNVTLATMKKLAGIVGKDVFEMIQLEGGKDLPLSQASKNEA